MDIFISLGLSCGKEGSSPGCSSRHDDLLLNKFACVPSSLEMKRIVFLIWWCNLALLLCLQEKNNLQIGIFEICMYMEV